MAITRAGRRSAAALRPPRRRSPARPARRIDQPGHDARRPAVAASGTRSSVSACPCAGPAPLLGVERTAGMNDSALDSSIGRPGSACSTSKSTDPGTPQPLAVGVAELGDQRPHIGARRALDHERACRSPSARELLEAVDVHWPGLELDGLPCPGHRVGASSPDLDRRVLRRSLHDRAGRERQVAVGDPAGDDDLAARDRRCRRPRRTGRPPRRSWATPSGNAAPGWRDRRAPAAGRSRTGRACRRGRPSCCAAAPAGSRRRRRAR